MPCYRKKQDLIRKMGNDRKVENKEEGQSTRARKRRNTKRNTPRRNQAKSTKTKDMIIMSHLRQRSTDMIVLTLD